MKCGLGLYFNFRVPHPVRAYNSSGNIAKKIVSIMRLYEIRMSATHSQKYGAQLHIIDEDKRV